MAQGAPTWAPAARNTAGALSYPLAPVGSQARAYPHTLPAPAGASSFPETLVIYVHDDLWPLFYTGRCKAIPTTQQEALSLGADRAVSEMCLQRAGLRGRSEEILVYRLVTTNVAGLLAQDAKDAGFLYPNELVTYLREQAGGRDVEEADVVQLAYFVRKRDL